MRAELRPASRPEAREAQRPRRLWRLAAAAAALALGAANAYFVKYAAVHALFHPPSDVRFNLYGDPQIEGDAKLAREPTTGRYDLLVNDYYLRHVYRATLAAFEPHYAVTMGDLFSSQWVSAREHALRVARFRWITGEADAQPAAATAKDGAVQPLPARGAHEYLHLAGNHDIGYGSETRPFHIRRFADSFGPLNMHWAVEVAGHRHHFAVVNAMNLDPTRHAHFRNETWRFVRGLARRRAEQPDVPLALFLHIPLSKPAGVCVESPVSRHTDDGFVRYQDYLSPAASAYLLHCLAPTLVLNGHDHAGCVATHAVRPRAEHPAALGASGRALHAAPDLCAMDLDELDRFRPEIERFAADTVAAPAPGAAPRLVVEATVRSTMGAYDGATGILDIAARRAAPLEPRVHTSAHGFALDPGRGWFTYRYREIRLGNHLVVRALAIVNVVAAAAAPAVLLLCRRRPP
ncbi:hypothetical protein H4R18_002199 [Coemansia javaensis]|uniref:Calcineurin-like phosphoesterase domain-containing protein n=1 Tax=Coemansia javaensis TaxID=2761396 RepID=A0A9W8LJI1_9FUNG|nr:hypothetical protein H4R18_002199 [Coemansia javaensis]